MRWRKKTIRRGTTIYELFDDIKWPRKKLVRFKNFASSTKTSSDGCETLIFLIEGIY
jgi:hypothetical protein